MNSRNSTHALDKFSTYMQTFNDVTTAVWVTGADGAEVAGRTCCKIYTLSAFEEDNPLSALGDLKVDIASHEYGFVETGRLAIPQGVLEIVMGCRAEP